MMAHDTGNYDAAHNHYHQSLEIFQELGDNSGASKFLHQIGNLAHLTGNYDKPAISTSRAWKFFRSWGIRTA